MSVWPLQPRYRLKKAWKFNGKHRKLAPGHYRWYVYPASGSATANKYGPLIGAERLRRDEALAGRSHAPGSAWLPAVAAHPAGRKCGEGKHEPRHEAEEQQAALTVVTVARWPEFACRVLSRYQLKG